MAYASSADAHITYSFHQTKVLDNARNTLARYHIDPIGAHVTLMQVPRTVEGITCFAGTQSFAAEFAACVE